MFYSGIVNPVFTPECAGEVGSSSTNNYESPIDNVGSLTTG